MIWCPFALAAFTLSTACGGGSGGSSAPETVFGNVQPPPPPTSRAPTPPTPLAIDAGYGRVVIQGDQITLSATETEGEASSIVWRQTAGTPVALDPNNWLTPSFTAPAVDSRETLSFQVTAQAGGARATDSVLVEV